MSRKKWMLPTLNLMTFFLFHSILFNFSNLGKIFRVEFYRTVSKFRKIIGSCFLLFPYSTKQEIRHFYSVILQQHQRKFVCTKKAWCKCRELCCFTNLNLLLFCFSCCYPCCHCLSSPMSPEWVNGPSNQVSMYLMGLFYHWGEKRVFNSHQLT